MHRLSSLDAVAAVLRPFDLRGFRAEICFDYTATTHYTATTDSTATTIHHCPPVIKCRRVRTEILHSSPDAQALGVREVAATPPTLSGVTLIPQSFVNVAGRKVCCP